MARRIFKQKLELVDAQVITVPAGAAVISAGTDPNNDLCVWFLFDDANVGPERPKTIYVHGTGHAVHENALHFIGTVRHCLSSGTYMWHVWSE